MPINPFIEFRKPDLATELKSVPDFLAAIGCSQKEINLISAKKFNQYKFLDVKKRSGGTRVLSVPNDRLKFLQRQVGNILSPLYRPRWCVQGFLKGRSALGNAQKHLGRKHLVKIDFKDYFGQITTSRVRGVLNYFGIDRGVTDIIVSLCMLLGSLPQGAPTSPLLANMITFRLDQRLVEYSRKNRLKYTRYADDIVFSSFSKPRILKSSVGSGYAKLRIDDIEDSLLEIFNEEGFLINEEKMFYCGANASRTVTGYTINEFANVPREHIRRIRSILHEIDLHGYNVAQLKFSAITNSIKSLKGSLRGRIGWVAATKGLSDPVYRRIAQRFNNLFPTDVLEVGPDFSKLATMSTWVIEATSLLGKKLPEAQGTVFFLEGYGLVTAAHCLPTRCSFEVFNVENIAVKYPVTVSKRHDHIDLAILSHNIPVDQYLELKPSKRESNVGEDIKSWGYPSYGPGKKLEVKTGRISSKPTVSTVNMYSLDVKIYQGTSGGPILNFASEVIGVSHKGGNTETHDLAVMIKHIDDV